MSKNLNTKNILIKDSTFKINYFALDFVALESWEMIHRCFFDAGNFGKFATFHMNSRNLPCILLLCRREKIVKMVALATT